ncbi:GUN4 domain-containing protein [Leptolyngbya sp. 7M]|uniref:GUN4 domain-containing protein n=1 Tax=Leptolyngbya sp. 7M TaxID=2812896 RepID=UPI001B8BED3C|nr:GUN4 domain-containing protein [Leptolyngbya sp. 7M]QYO62885.1 GUN4 domain-containing protein [Leptolyngbya sp. 7M]
MANNWAIIIGINQYEHHPERQLNYAVPDAQLIYEFLSTQAGFAPDQIRLCLGETEYRTSPTYPTYATLIKLLNRDLDPSRIGPVDRLWFFFAGHGVSQNGRDYLLTADSLLEDIELKIALPIDEVIASLRRHQTADIVLVLDNCRQLQGSRTLISAEVGKQTVELAQSRGITTIFACDYGQYSYELDSVKQGAFTYALVEGLKHHTLPDQLEQYLRRRVAELNQRRDQVPRIRVEPASKALQPLLPNAVTAADITVLVNRATKAELEEDFETAKQLWWEIIEAAQSRDRIREARSAIDRVDRKIARLRNNYSVGTNPPQPEQSQPLIAPLPAELTISPFISSNDDLSSERFGANYYTKLRDLLKAGNWKKADRETANRMCEVIDRQKEGWFREEDIQMFPCQDLLNIDRLWVKYSDGKFGFSVQKRIYLECGGKPDGKYPGKDIWERFGDRLGWIRNGRWIYYEDVISNTSAVTGHLPLLRVFDFVVGGSWGLFSRIEACKL